jgi:hypothetical protein
VSSLKCLSWVIKDHKGRLLTHYWTTLSNLVIIISQKQQNPPQYSPVVRSELSRNTYLLVNFGGGHSQIVQILGIAVSFIHAATGGDAMLQEVGAGAPVGVVLHTTAAQLLTGK